MYKIVFICSMLLGSFSSFAQYESSSSSSSENKMEGTFPELKSEQTNQYKFSAGVASGVSSPTGDATSSMEYGLVLGFQPIALIGAGVEANTTRLDTANDIRQTNVLLRSTYNVGGDVPVLRSSFLGVGLGPVFVSNRVRWAGAPLVGFDIPLSSKSHDFISLGLEAKYLFVTNTDVPDLFASTLALKYWF
ncbi:MAG: hypothetical protein Q7U04_18220 [Bacteriovorax sp.]|nr:hypothetical protein [Bacteriovorax sp.]